jgi:hypothetical protein
VGESSGIQTITARNCGTAPLRISDIQLAGNSGAFQVDDSRLNLCFADLQAGASCAIDLRFTPQTAGSQSIDLLVTHTGTDSPARARLSGTGVNPAPSIDVNPPVLFFAQAGSQQVTLTNVGSAELVIHNIVLDEQEKGSFLLDPGSCGSGDNQTITLAPSSSCSLSITYRCGLPLAFLTITSNADNGPQLVALTGLPIDCGSEHQEPVIIDPITPKPDL